MKYHRRTQYLLRLHLGIDYIPTPPSFEDPEIMNLHDYISEVVCLAASAYYSSGLAVLELFKSNFMTLFIDIKMWLYYAHVCKTIIPKDPRASLILYLIKDITEVIGVSADYVGVTKLGCMTVTYHYTGLCYERLGVKQQSCAVI